MTSEEREKRRREQRRRDNIAERRSFAESELIFLPIWLYRIISFGNWNERTNVKWDLSIIPWTCKNNNNNNNNNNNLFLENIFNFFYSGVVIGA